MKFIWLSRLSSFQWRQGERDKKFERCQEGQEEVIRRVVKFEDCEKINRNFAIQIMETTSARNQYIAAVTVNIAAIAVGASIGWASPSLPLLQSEDSVLDEPLTSSEASWVGSFLALGALCGTLLFGWLSEKVGRFWATLLTTVPEILWWASIMIGSSVPLLLAGRFFSGLAAGGVFVLVPLYISEISEDNIRGVLGSFFIFSINFGTLLMFIAGSYLSYSVVPRVMVSLPIIFALTFAFLPETPQHLLKCGKTKEAENSLKFLRGCRNEIPEKVKNELMEMSKKIEEDSAVKAESIWRELNSPVAIRALIIGLVLVSVNQLCGCFAFINYTADIFSESGSSLSPNMSAIIVAIIQVGGSTAATFAISSMSRKLLYALTCFGTIVGLLAMGMHGYLKMYYDMENFNWVPIASLSFVIFVASIGLLPLTFVMLSEILPQKIRSFGVSLCTAVLWSISFLLLRYFNDLVQLLQLYVCMLIFCAFTAFGMVFVIFFVPETRNRSNEQIENALKRV